MEYASNYVYGIAIAVIVLWSWLYLLHKTSCATNRNEELLTMLNIARVIRSALQTVVVTVQRDEWGNAAHHIAICELRLKNFTPQCEDAIAIKMQMQTVVGLMKDAVNDAKIDNWKIATEKVKRAATLYNDCLKNIRQFVNDNTEE